MRTSSIIPLAALAALAALSAGPSVAADPPGDAAEGGRLAARVCAACHATGATGVGTDSAPPLPGIAAARDDDSLRLFLAAPHGAMPPVSLTRREIADLVAWLATLRPPSGPKP